MQFACKLENGAFLQISQLLFELCCCILCVEVWLKKFTSRACRKNSRNCYKPEISYEAEKSAKRESLSNTSQSYEPRISFEGAIYAVFAKTIPCLLLIHAKRRALSCWLLCIFLFPPQFCCVTNLASFKPLSELEWKLTSISSRKSLRSFALQAANQFRFIHAQIWGKFAQLLFGRRILFLPFWKIVSNSS